MICPRCGAKIAVESCPACGFGAHRDNMPMIWAERRYWELLQKIKQPTFPTPATVVFLTS
ncbi:hypothetical protein [Pyrobaculum islandicum]|uniref:hypothetical protein n=1 Tax=Pyrobaculum islandicum TaxID=2277 RepID=UPI000A6A493E